MTDKFLTPAEIADQLKIHERTVHRWLNDGKLKGIKLDRFWRIEAKEFAAFLDRHKEKVEH